MAEFGLRWQEFDRKDRLVSKEKFFETDKAREQFVDRLQKKDNFHGIVAMCNEK